MISTDLGLLSAAFSAAVGAGWYSETHSGFWLGWAIFGLFLFICILVEKIKS